MVLSLSDGGGVYRAGTGSFLGTIFLRDGCGEKGHYFGRRGHVARKERPPPLPARHVKSVLRSAKDEEKRLEKLATSGNIPDELRIISKFTADKRWMRGGAGQQVRMFSSSSGVACGCATTCHQLRPPASNCHLPSPATTCLHLPPPTSTCHLPPPAACRHLLPPATCQYLPPVATSPPVTTCHPPPLATSGQLPPAPATTCHHLLSRGGSQPTAVLWPQHDLCRVHVTCSPRFRDCHTPHTHGTRHTSSFMAAVLMAMVAAVMAAVVAAVVTAIVAAVVTAIVAAVVTAIMAVVVAAVVFTAIVAA